ncbi:transcription factor LHW [Punica granatum]|uniref:Transcription factor LHW n=2 Tax=Punica granatum TaxID=22663 RepID=A0A6P8E378_PUNGR|nr:transcription factor LHW [Punica granatum]PKI73363.1 hypothetical protein CRG98_006301 [Punica granatum]
MGYLLKEALKTLCGVNQWAYAVFWKIGCQNPKLLIWEECYYEPLVCPVPPENSGIRNSETALAEWERCLVTPEVQAGGRIQLLIDQMMVKNQINILGEGIIGRAAFTGNHQWILSKSFNGDAHPPEVLNEMHNQFSAGIQTVAVIPISSHGVVQLGSSLSITENMGFVNNVRSLILQLGCIPSALLSDNYATKVAAPVSLGMPCNIPSENCKLTGPTISGQASLSSALVGNVHNTARSRTAPVFQNSNQPNTCQPKFGSVIKTIRPFQDQSGSSFLTIDEIPHNSDMWTSGLVSTEKQSIADVINQNFLSNARPKLKSSEAVNCDLLQVSDAMLNGPSRLNSPANFSPLNAINPDDKDMHDSSKLEGVSLFNMKNRVLSRSSYHHSEVECPKNEDEHVSIGGPPSQWFQHFEKQDAGSQGTVTNAKYEEPSFEQHSSGDDLFDILGVELKNKILGSSSHRLGETGKEIPIPMNMQEDSSDFYAMPESLYEDSRIFSGLSSDDHLLDAVVSRAQSVSKQCSDDNLSCKTTLTKISSSSVPTNSPTFRGINTSFEHIEREMFGFPKPLEKVKTPVSPSFKSGCSKEGPCSQATSLYGSQISSWVEQSHSVKVENSVSTGYSKRPDGVTKPNRKRLKPGENPRPRPKDRQMIQDRVKELREIVPNGAKCSIDALLERTIKHMLFLQSVTKHADKLKESGESKIINEEGGLLLKDNFEGGATWAFEVGSQSMVCPIIVEDLNPPRQMLVEMLCEDRGLFLEIADMIRGLGLTILKGVMEARNHKIWARFAVEANRDVTRMEIFMSLVRLLDQTAKGSETNSMGPLHPFPQPVSIPTTCGPQ